MILSHFACFSSPPSSTTTEIHTFPGAVGVASSGGVAASGGGALRPTGGVVSVAEEGASSVGVVSSVSLVSKIRE